MGYQRKSYVIKWPEGHMHHGLVVKLRGLSGGNLIKVTSFRDEAGAEEKSSLDPEVLNEMLEILASRIIEWNLEDDGEPIPPTIENLRNEDFGMVMDIITSWTKAVTHVPAPLLGDSNSGNTFPEASIPMETL